MIIGRINQIAFYNHFPGVLHHTNAKSAILPIALPGSTGTRGTWTSHGRWTLFETCGGLRSLELQMV